VQPTGGVVRDWLLLGVVKAIFATARDRHSAKVGMRVFKQLSLLKVWIPAFAGMTAGEYGSHIFDKIRY
jgi:hypothetical protein